MRSHKFSFEFFSSIKCVKTIKVHLKLAKNNYKKAALNQYKFALSHNLVTLHEEAMELLSLSLLIDRPGVAGAVLQTAS